MLGRKLILPFVGLFVVVTLARGELPSEDEETIIRPRYHVDILKRNAENEGLEHVCDGAILDGRYVLTAAHCVFNEQTGNLLIRSGSDVAPPENMPHHEERLFHRVTRIMYPMDYVHLPCRHHEHDIAILKVNRAFDLAYDRLYKQVNLPEYNNDYEGYDAVVSGYTDEKLTTFEAQIISNEECSRNATAIITRGNICGILAPETVETYAKISGSPLVHENTIIGIMNAPNKCESDAKISIQCGDQSTQLKLYTRVTSYLEFIEKVLNSQAAADIVYRS